MAWCLSLFVVFWLTVYGCLFWLNGCVEVLLNVAWLEWLMECFLNSVASLGCWFWFMFAVYLARLFALRLILFVCCLFALFVVCDCCLIDLLLMLWNGMVFVGCCCLLLCFGFCDFVWMLSWVLLCWVYLFGYGVLWFG